MNPYNDSPEAAEEAAVLLLERGGELIEKDKRTDAIWNNLGFHVATARLRMTGCDVPIGPTAQVYIGLVLAADESVRAQKLIDQALETEETA